MSWPGGASERFAGVGPGGRYVLRQGAGAQADRRRGGSERRLELVASAQESAAASTGRRVVLSARVSRAAPQPRLLRRTRAPPEPVASTPGTALLVNVLGELVRTLPGRAARSDRAMPGSFGGAGLDVVALSIDGLDEGRGDDVRPTPTSWMSELAFPFRHGMGDGGDPGQDRHRQACSLRPDLSPGAALLAARRHARRQSLARSTTAASRPSSCRRISPSSTRESRGAAREMAVPFTGRLVRAGSREGLGRPATRAGSPTAIPDEAEGAARALGRAGPRRSASGGRAAVRGARAARQELTESLRALAVLAKTRQSFGAAAQRYTQLLEVAPQDEGGARRALLDALFDAGELERLGRAVA